MSKNMHRPGVFFILPGLLFLALSAAIQEAGSSQPEKGPLVEVHGQDIAYVPATAKHVTYNGVVRKIVRFSAALNEGQEDCQCPKCCQGRCYIIIYTDLVMPGGPLRMLYILWLEC